MRWEQKIGYLIGKQIGISFFHLLYWNHNLSDISRLRGLPNHI